jgi:hypothetical protein
MATAAALPNTILLNTSNDFVFSEQIGTTVREIRNFSTTTLGAWAETKPRIGLAILWADTDGALSYRALAEQGVDILWLDSYCCSWGVRPASKNLRKIAASWKRQPLAWYQGVKTARDTIIALKLAERLISCKR